MQKMNHSSESASSLARTLLAVTNTSGISPEEAPYHLDALLSKYWMSESVKQLSLRAVEAAVLPIGYRAPLLRKLESASPETTAEDLHLIRRAVKQLIEMNPELAKKTAEERDTLASVSASQNLLQSFPSLVMLLNYLIKAEPGKAASKFLGLVVGMAKSDTDARKALKALDSAAADALDFLAEKPENFVEFLPKTLVWEVECSKLLEEYETTVPATLLSRYPSLVSLIAGAVQQFRTRPAKIAPAVVHAMQKANGDAALQRIEKLAQKGMELVHPAPKVESLQFVFEASLIKDEPVSAKLLDKYSNLEDFLSLLTLDFKNRKSKIPALFIKKMYDNGGRIALNMLNQVAVKIMDAATEAGSQKPEEALKMRTSVTPPATFAQNRYVALNSLMTFLLDKYKSQPARAANIFLYNLYLNKQDKYLRMLDKIAQDYLIELKSKVIKTKNLPEVPEAFLGEGMVSVSAVHAISDWMKNINLSDLIRTAKSDLDPKDVKDAEFTGDFDLTNNGLEIMMILNTQDGQEALLTVFDPKTGELLSADAVEPKTGDEETGDNEEPEEAYKPSLLKATVSERLFSRT